MGWTYDNNPNTTDASGRRDSVRMKIGDTDCDNQLVSDEEIAGALAEAEDNIYLAGSIVADALSAKFAAYPDVSIGNNGLDVDMSALSKRFKELGATLRKQAKRFGSSFVGVPVAGGISKSEVSSREENNDWNQPAFSEGQFDNP